MEPVLQDSGFQPANQISHFGILAAFLVYFWPQVCAGYGQFLCSTKALVIRVYVGATANSNARAIASAVTPVFMISFRILGQKTQKL